MKFIKSVKKITPHQPNGKTILFMHGYGGRTWQARRQLKILEEAGYRIIALDFVMILHNHDPRDLINLMDEVDEFMKKEGLIREDLLIVGISLGSLVGYNMMRRHDELTKLIAITGGNIALLPTRRSLRKHWRITRDELEQKWRGVNMYTPPGKLRGKKVIMLLPLRDKMIDPDEVADEITVQQAYNDITVVRTKGGHFRTIITETVLRPRRLLHRIDQLH